jgi:hypothetical protein
VDAVSTQPPVPSLPEPAGSGEAPVVLRSYEARAEIQVRHMELKSLSERLDNVAALSRAEKWGVRYQLLVGAMVGGVVGFVPFIASGPSLGYVVAYVVVLAVALLVTGLHREATKDIAAERADSILAIKEHIDKTMLTTETARLQAPNAARRLPPGGGLGESPATPSPPQD